MQTSSSFSYRYPTLKEVGNRFYISTLFYHSWCPLLPDDHPNANWSHKLSSLRSQRGFRADSRSLSWPTAISKVLLELVVKCSSGEVLSPYFKQKNWCATGFKPTTFRAEGGSATTRRQVLYNWTVKYNTLVRRVQMIRSLRSYNRNNFKMIIEHYCALGFELVSRRSHS